MSQHDFTHALARLLSDARLRERFGLDPVGVASMLARDDLQMRIISAIDPEQLERQADSLLRKRQSHVMRIIPGTWRQLGAAAQKTFREYAVRSCWPEGHKRHVLDAARFCEFLRLHTPHHPVAAEYHWAAFLAGNRRLAVRLLRKLPIGDRTHFALQVLYRDRNGIARQLQLSARRRGAIGLREESSSRKSTHYPEPTQHSEIATAAN